MSKVYHICSTYQAMAIREKKMLAKRAKGHWEHGKRIRRNRHYHVDSSSSSGSGSESDSGSEGSEFHIVGACGGVGAGVRGLPQGAFAP